MLVILYDPSQQASKALVGQCSRLKCYVWNIHHPQVKHRLGRSSILRAIKEFPAVAQIDSTGNVQLFSGPDAFNAVSNLLHPPVPVPVSSELPSLPASYDILPVPQFGEVVSTPVSAPRPPPPRQTKRQPAAVIVEDEVDEGAHEEESLPPAAPRGNSWGEFESDDLEITPESAAAPAIPLTIQKEKMLTSNAAVESAKKKKPAKLSAVEMAQQMALERKEHEPSDHRRGPVQTDFQTHPSSLHPDPPGLRGDE